MALGFRQSGQWVLDIGGANVVMLHISGDPGNLKLRQLFDWPLPEGLVIDGEIVDADLFARELKALVNQHKLRGRSVQVGVSNQKVIVRTIDMPEMTEEELRGAIEYQAQDYIPIPVDEAVLDFQVVGKRVTPDGSSHQEVLLVAAQRAMIETLLGALRQAGLKLAGIDVSSLALVRALLPPASFLGDTPEGAVCRGIADISSSVSTLVVAVDGIMKFTRIVNFSSEQFPAALSLKRGIPLADAQTMVQRLGLAGPLPADAEYYPEDVVADTQTQLAQEASILSDEIRRSFDYYQGQENSSRVTELILSGRGALVKNLDAHLSEALGLPVTLGNPLVHIAQNASDLTDANLAFMAPALAVPIGLALSGED